MNHDESPDVHELVERRATAEKRAVINPNVTGQQTIVRDDDIVADLAIVSDVRPRHQKILVADCRRAALGATAMNSAVFADDVVVADLDLGFSFQRK